MLVAFFATMLAAASPATPNVVRPSEIDQAIAMRRFDQAQMMIAAAAKEGSSSAIKRPLATLAFAAGRNEEALARLAALLVAAPNDALLLEYATIAAIRSGKTAQATLFAARATRAPAASWRAWNAKGVLADAARDWDEADRAYGRAAALAPDRPEVANNLGWSRVLRGDWQGASEALAHVATSGPGSVRMANNRDLARMALAAELPTQRAGEPSGIHAARLNDAGVAAWMRGEQGRARAAFAQAIVVSGRWYERADANLAIVEGRK